MAFTHPRMVRFQDTDAAGVVYFANVLAICHEAYEASLAVAGINLKLFFNNSSVAIPIVHAEVDFFRPLFCGDALVIQLTPQKTGIDEFEVIYQVFLAKNTEKSVAKAITRHVCISPLSRTRQPLPPEIVEWFARWTVPS